MRRWICERLDDCMLPLLKLASPGHRRRLAAFRPAQSCDLADLVETAAPADIGLSGETVWRGFRQQDYQFPSPVQSQCPENQLVTGRLIVASPDAPWTLVVPGYATGAFSRGGYSFFQDVQGLGLLQRGMNVALIDLPFHMRRRRHGSLSGEGFFSPDLSQTQSALRQATADAVALVRWLEQRSGQAVGLWGTSLGGCVAGLVATCVPGLAAVALMEPLDNPGAVLATLPGSWEIREAIAGQGGPPADQLAGLLKAVAPSSYSPAVDRARLLFVTPLWDRVVPTRFQEEFWEAWGKPQRILWEASHVTTAANRVVTAQVCDFLSRWVFNRAHQGGPEHV